MLSEPCSLHWPMRLSSQSMSSVRNPPVLFVSASLPLTTAGKKWNKDKLTSRIEESTNIMKSVFRFVFPYRRG